MSRFTTTRARPHTTTHWFTVTGRGVFPIDMLRSDMAWPATSEDAEKIVGHDFGYAFGPGSTTPSEHRSIRMGCAQHDGPTIGRWASFGWTVGDPDKGEID
jgi:hypothetical protein